MKDIVYMDHAATTRMRPEAVEAMLPYFTEEYGNASALYSLGQQAKQALEEARSVLAKTICAGSGEIYFTAGGSESDNWAIRGAAEACAGKGRHIITTKIEHHAVLHTCNDLEKQGYDVTYLDVDKDGLVSVDDVAKAIREDTVLISVMFANNEIGTIEPIRQIGRLAREKGILFHTDAVQAYGHLPIDVEEMKIDLLSASGHKFGGPKGVGFLYIRKGVKIRSLIRGGAQERNRRAGTENLPGIVGMAKAAELAVAEMEERSRREAKLRDHMIERLENEIPYVRLNGHRTQRLANNVNMSFQFVEGESMLILLDSKKICASSGSACTSGSLDPSHVLLAIGLPHEIAHGSLRLTLGEETTMEQADYTVDCVKEIVARLRAMSPLYEDFLKENKKMQRYG